MSDLTILNPPRITLEAFAGALRDAHSPALDEAESCYGAFVDAGVDPAVALAIAKHEHSFWKAGVAIKTRGWGNVTAAALLCLPHSRRVGVVGRFAAYATYLDGAIDWAAYVRARYVDRGLTTVQQMIPIYAPASDGNAPAAYIADVVATVARWQARSDPWAAWGTAHPLPPEQRGFAIPAAWLADGGRLGAACSAEISLLTGAARLFTNGAIVWDRVAGNCKVYR